MSTVRYMIQGNVKDADAFRDLSKRACDTISQEEPDTLAYEWFTDEASGTATIHELYATPDAFLGHLQRVTENGLMDDLMGCFEITGVTSLNRIDDERVQGALASFGANFQHGLAGVTR